LYNDMRTRTRTHTHTHTHTREHAYKAMVRQYTYILTKTLNIM